MDDETPRAERNTRVTDGARRSRARIEAIRDHEAMRWMARFRFVTPAGLAERFDVTERNMRARVVRLEKQGFLCLDRAPHRAMTAYLSHAGYDAVGLPSRKGPRVDSQREHELAIVWQVAHFEKHQNPRVEVLTERECRIREQAGLGPFHIRAAGERSGGTRGQRWPDLVMIVDQKTRIAIELEFTAKHLPRLQRIVSGYVLSDYDRVVYYVLDLPLARQLVSVRDAAIAGRQARRPEFLGPARVPRFDVEAWPHAPAERIAPIRAWS
jgi:hypothetical protein